jgi:hypothetical protein
VLWNSKNKPLSTNDFQAPVTHQFPVEASPPVETQPILTPPVAQLTPSPETQVSKKDEVHPDENQGSIETGHLEVNVRPWAKVRVNGIDKGTTPLKKMRLKTGDHRVTLTNNELGYKKTIYVKIRNGKTTSINRTISENDG